MKTTDTLTSSNITHYILHITYLGLGLGGDLETKITLHIIIWKSLVRCRLSVHLLLSQIELTKVDAKLKILC